jgi:uncharacterized protein (TIRG00374 family)
MAAIGVQEAPGVIGRRIGLLGALWVAAGLGLALAALIYQAAVTGEFWRLQIGLLAPALAFGCASFGLRTIRWHTFLLAAGVHPPLLTSLKTQLVGFSLTLTPGKVGELYKAYLMERATGTPTARMAPIVLFEKIMDGLAFTGLALIAGAALPELNDDLSTGARSLLGLGALALAVVVVVRRVRPEAAERVLTRFLASVPFGRKLVSVITAALQGGSAVLRPPLLVQNLGLSVLARTCDGLAMMFCAAAFGLALSPIGGVFALNASGALGGFSMLPGGIGVVEAGMAVILISLGFEAGPAIAATLVTRLLTFWLWVTIGLILLLRSSLRSSNPAAS